MAIYRKISMSFWTDAKVVDDFTPEDRYFYLYLFTNPHTNLCGCYEISFTQMANETGYNKDSVERLIRRFADIHKIIQYSSETKEILLLNWHKYNWTSSEKFRKPLIGEIEKIKCNQYREYLLKIFNGEKIGYGIDTTYIDTTVTVTDTVTVTNSNTVNINNSNNNISNSNSKKHCNEADELIESLWQLYPKKRGKSSISKKVKPKILAIGYDHMARAIERYKEEVKGKDEQYILMGSTFFNGRYEDYLDENYVPPKNKTQQNADVFKRVAAGMAGGAYDI